MLFLSILNLYKVFYDKNSGVNIYGTFDKIFAKGQNLTTDPIKLKRSEYLWVVVKISSSVRNLTTNP